MYTPMTLNSKAKLRQELRQRRDLYHQTPEGKDSGHQLLEKVVSAGIIPDHVVIGSYWPVKSEVDVRPLLTYFFDQGHACALPAVQGTDMPLSFRQWCPGDLLVSGIYNILTPDESAPEVIPLVLFIPVLGFDARGHRLGYGKGYYDRTLEKLRESHHIVAIGLAFDCQELESVPHDSFDQRLDIIITPTRVIEIRE